MKIRFYHEGDQSVGVSGESITVEIDAESADNPLEYVKFFASSIKPGLTDFWDFPVHWEVILPSEFIDNHSGYFG